MLLNTPVSAAPGEGGGDTGSSLCPNCQMTSSFRSGFCAQWDKVPATITPQ